MEELLRQLMAGGKTAANFAGNEFMEIGASGAEILSSPSMFAQSIAGNRDVAQQFMDQRNRRRSQLPTFEADAETAEIQSGWMEPISEAMSNMAQKYPNEAELLSDVVSDPSIQALGSLVQAGEMFAPVSATRAVKSFMDKPELPDIPTSGTPGAQQGSINMLGDGGIEPVTMETVSTRLPTAVKATENPFEQDLTVSIDQMRPEAFEKTMNLFRGYDQYGNLSKNPSEALEQVTELQSGNLNFIMERMDPEWRDRSMDWYEGFNRLAQDAAKKHGVSNEQAAGVIATLSPQTDWNMNLTRADRVIDTYQTRQNFPWSQEMDQKIGKIADSVNKPNDKAAVGNIIGKRLSELETPKEKALWIRTYDEAHNPRWYNEYTPEGEKAGIAKTKGGQHKVANWASTDSIERSVRMLEDGSMDSISRNLGKGHKVRSFYRNAADVNDPNTTTMDTHAVAANMFSPHGASAVPVGHNFGAGVSDSVSGIKGTYPIHQQSYNQVAKEWDIPSRKVQSPTWEGSRSMFEGQKTPRKKQEAANIWRQYNEGNINANKAREMIYDAFGGFKTPDWVGSR